MDVFELRQRLVDDYARYTRSFIKIADPRTKDWVDGIRDRGARSLLAVAKLPEPLESVQCRRPRPTAVTETGHG